MKNEEEDERKTDDDDDDDDDSVTIVMMMMIIGDDETGRAGHGNGESTAGSRNKTKAPDGPDKNKSPTAAGGQTQNFLKKGKASECSRRKGERKERKRERNIDR